MNHIVRSAVAAVALGIATGATMSGVAAGADLLLAPTGAASGDPAAWTPVVEGSYGGLYSDLQCLTLPAPGEAAATYDLGTAPSGQWVFVVVATETGDHQYGPAEFDGAQVPAGAGATGVIGCHGSPAPTMARQVSAASAEIVDGDAGTVTPSPSAGSADPVPVSQTSSASPAPTVPATVSSGLEGGRGGLVVLGVGAVLVAGLALLGRRARP